MLRNSWGSALILRARILVTRASISESTYSYNMQIVYQKKISICLNGGHEESMDDYYTLRAEATSIFFCG